MGEFAAGSAFVALVVSPALWRVVSRVSERQKTRDVLWRLCTHATTASLGFAACARPWATSPHLLWEGWPHQKHESLIVTLYAVFFGFTLGSIPEVRRSNETKTMLLHHALTVGLVGASFASGLLRVGAIIMILNDVVDIWFEAAKLCHYAGHEEASRRFLYVFVLTWTIFRQCGVLVLFKCAHSDGMLHSSSGLAILALSVMLAALWVVQAYWLGYLLRKVRRIHLDRRRSGAKTHCI